MDTRKKIIIGSLLLSVFLLCFFILFKSSNNKQQSSIEMPQVDYPVPLSSDEKIKINTNKGIIEVANIYGVNFPKLSADGIEFENNEDFYMAYYPQNQGFVIVIQNIDIESARKKAEDRFLEVLEITKNQACSLDVSMTVPMDISEMVSGGEYGLSFCSNGKPFRSE